MAHRREALASPRVTIAIDDATTAGDMTRILGARGLAAEPMPLERIIARGASPSEPASAVAFAPDEPPSAELVARMAPICQAGAESGWPFIVLCAFPRTGGKHAMEQIAALAYLRSFGAVICTEPDTWLETICLVATYGLPRGPRVAIVAPQGGWLAASATALANEAAVLGRKFPMVARSPSRLEPTDIALVERSALSPSTPKRVGSALVIPVVGRAELLDSDSRVPLVGLRSALFAAGAAGQLASRLQGGLGPDVPARESDDLLAALEPDIDRFERQVDKLDTRAGDHETKVLLASWGIPVIRQAVATTPSAATRVAKKAGYPVEVKPWGPDQLSERDGCPVATELTTAAEVRRAVVTVAKAAGLPAGAPVIVREAPPPGREVSARCIQVGALGWVMIVEVAGASEPAAAPCPLGEWDARTLAETVEASRASDPAPDRAALADILLRASHLARHHEDSLVALYLHRIVVTTRDRKSVVVDAQAVLLPPG